MLDGSSVADIFLQLGHFEDLYEPDRGQTSTELAQAIQPVGAEPEVLKPEHASTKGDLSDIKGVVPSNESAQAVQTTEGQLVVPKPERISVDRKCSNIEAIVADNGSSADNVRHFREQLVTAN